MKVVTDFICKLIDEPVFNYSSKASLEMLPHLLYIKVHRVNFSSLYKGFYASKNDVFAILLLIISIIIELIFAFII